LSKFKDLMTQHADELASIITQEHGKTTPDAKGELQRALEVVEFAIGIPHLLKSEYSPNVGTDIDSWSMYQPLGVCVGVTPFNFPAMVPLWMFPIALACGNTFILKPSEQTPTCAIEIAKLLTESGVPDGVFNVVHGNKNAVTQLISHQDTQAVSFVGSTPVAQSIYETASKHGKRVQALGGAKNHLIAMPDANLEQTVNGIMGAAFGSAGERCMAISVVVAVGDIAEPLVDALKQKIKTLKVGPGNNLEIEMGPVISKAHLERIHTHIEQGIAQGANCIVDGRTLKSSETNNGCFIGPCLFDNVQSNMDIYQQEIFGPVLCVVRVPDYKSALALINAHEFGNGTAIYTQNGAVARDFIAQVEVGMVGVNVAIPVPMAFHSFGGWKRSLFGQSHVHGPEGVRFYSRLKTVTARWNNVDKNISYQMPTLG
jgi:malonate-semialdehyde dehydrogenase (acetylating) / methylmalonate-semialdehyde dehydrogenase